RAFTPKERKAIRAAAMTFRDNEDLDEIAAFTSMGTGEALVSFLEDKGVPSVVEQTLIRPPCAQIGPLTPEERTAVIGRSPFAGKYDEVVDRESAHEMVAKRQAERLEAEKKLQEEKASADSGWANVVFGKGPRGGRSLGEQVARDVGRSFMRRMINSGVKALLRGVGIGGRR
ncbi:MAG: helicase HerA-like domain-containing protein, partial [Pseudomonadota bacterium]